MLSSFRAGGLWILCVILCFALGALPAFAQTAPPPWCGVDLLGPGASPYPAPRWSEIPATPDYHDISNNFRVTQSLRLLASSLEKGLAQLGDAGSLANMPDVDGVCLCNCGRDAASWATFLQDTVQTEAEQALQETQDRYLADLDNAIAASQKTILGAVPTFRKDIEEIVLDICKRQITCDPKDPNAALKDLARDISGVAQKAAETVYQNELEKFKQLVTGPGGAKERIQAVGQEIKNLQQIFQSGKPLGASLNELGERLAAIGNELGKIVRDTADGAADLARKYTAADLQAWTGQVLQAVDARLAQVFDNDQAIAAEMRGRIEAKIQDRLVAIKSSAQAVYTTATDLRTSADRFAKSLTEGVIADLKQVDGCYGVTKRGDCTVKSEDFCAGTVEGELFGQTLPLWFPTETFRDGKTAFLWALETIDWLQKVKEILPSSAPPKLLEGGETLVEVLKNGADLLAKLSDYVDTFTTGYHLGAYSNVRPDLHMCIGWAGNGALAEIADFNVGSKRVRAGASYLSANLVRKHRAQFRSGGFAVNVDGNTLPLVPGVSLNLQADGFRFWDRDRPFGLGPQFSIDPSNADTLDVFSLIKPGKVCCATGETEGCLLCPVTASSLLYTPFYKIKYAADSREWPRPGVEWEEGTPATAVLGAGLNLDLQSKEYRWSTAPLPLFPGFSVTPWMELSAGVGWKYEENHLRSALLGSLNKNLPAGQKLEDKVFARDEQALQAPDVTEDVGHTAEVNPRVGADLTLGLNLARWLTVGITANLFVGAKVEAGGFGGVLDLHRPLVETLAQSNPVGDRCEPVIQDRGGRRCSNESFRRPDRCAGTKDCVDLSPPVPPDRVYSTGTYACDDACAQHGYCQSFRRGKIILHDTTREVCETPARGGFCSAFYQDNPSGGGQAVAFSEENIAKAPPYGLPLEDIGPATELADAAAFPRITQAVCEGAGWCFNWVYKPEHPFSEDYVSSFTGIASSLEGCPPARYADGRIVLHHRTGQPIRGQFLPFEWLPGPGGDEPAGRFFPYQCAGGPQPEVTGYQGPDCNPLEYGYPSACPGSSCACEPDGAACPGGKVCADGACLESCGSCAQGFECRAGACVLANGVPFAEQVAWRLKHAGEPRYSVASYALDKLEVSAVAGLGVRVGLDYRLFRKWKRKSLLDLNETFPLLTLPLVKHQLGLEARYQDDCTLPAGEVTNHQPDLVRRHPGGGTAGGLLAFCKPQMEKDVENPAPPPPVEEMVQGGLDSVFQFGLDVGGDLWSRGQLCIDGIRSDAYFNALYQDPARTWPLLRCAYTRNGRRIPLDCSGPLALQTSLVAALGCLDVEGSDALLDSRLLAALLAEEGTLPDWLIPGAAVPALDFARVFYDTAAEPYALFNLYNVVSALRAFDGRSPQGGLPAFSVNRWVSDLDRCLADTPSGRMDENALELGMPLDLQPCGGACCGGGECTEVAGQAACDGSFSPGLTCSEVDEASCAAAGSVVAPGGSCLSAGHCQQVVSAQQCAGGLFFAGGTCTGLPSLCETDDDCAEDHWCRGRQDGVLECVPRVGEGASCGGFVLPWTRQQCANGLVCWNAPDDPPDFPGVCRRTCAPPPRAQVAWWPFDEPAGPIAADTQALHDGRHAGGPMPMTGRVGGALSFDGIDDQVEVPDAPELDFGTGDFSIVTWIRTSVQSRATRSILDKRRAGVGYHLYLWQGRPGLQLAVGGSHTNYTAASRIADGAWHLLAVTVDRERPDGLRWYLDGELVGSAADPTRYRGSLNNASPLRLGVRSVAEDGWWKGALDELMLFDRVLDPGEMRALFTASGVGACKCVNGPRGVRAWWSLDQLDPVFGRLADEAGGPIGQVTGAESVEGIAGRALAFDGIDDLVSVPDSPGLALGSGDFSLELWVRTERRLGIQLLLDKQGPTAGFQLYQHAGKLGLHLADGTAAVNLTSGAFVADGRWHHVAVTVDRDRHKGVRWYLDGREVGPRGDPTHVRGSLNSAVELRWAPASRLLGSIWRGTLDELALFGRVLAPEEIRAIYRARGFGKCTGSRPILEAPSPP